MKIPLQVTFRNMKRSDAVESEIYDKADWLERYYGRITGCHVMVEAPHKRRHQGKLFHVRVDLILPGVEFVVRRDPPKHHAHENIRVAIRDAFDAARRRMEDYVRRQHRPPKAHLRPARARVAEIFPDEGYGFLEAEDGQRVYFHRNSVLQNGFPRLNIGAEVRFTEELGDQGPQASTVRPS